MQPWQDESLTFEERAQDLVSRMTLEEKISQMGYMSTALPRFALEDYNWWNECLHGVARNGTATVFPQAIAMAAAFDEELLARVATAISDEARAKHHAAARQGDFGIYKGLTFWTPNINIFRDPRWGRGHETYGEDPVLTARLGVAFCRALQGDDPKYLKAIATVKHFAVHSGPEKLRHELDVQVSLKDMKETYLPAFKACVKAGAYSVMGAYNRVNGEPACGSRTLLQDILRKKWGFKGYVVSDCGAVEDFDQHHKITADGAESAAMAVKNGCDLCCGAVFERLKEAVERGLVDEAAITESCRRLILARMKLGMFDDDAHVPYAAIPFEVNDCEEHHELALEAARRSLVLLKNDGLLPLNRDRLRTVAVIGPNADHIPALTANYNGKPSECYTVLQGVKALCPGARVLYAPGCTLSGKPDQEAWGERPGAGLAEAITCASLADVVILVTGLDATMEGEEGDAGDGDKTSLALPEMQQRLLEAVAGAGRPVILVNMTGSAVELAPAQERCAAILQAWYPGQYGGLAVAETLLGLNNPSGRLPITFYKDLSQVPDFTDYSMEGRTYRYLSEEPLYPFGYGLSYTRFGYSQLKISSGSLKAGDELTCTVTVANRGETGGWETVQLYMAGPQGADGQPLRALKGFRSLYLEPGDKMKVTFVLEPEDLACVRDDGEVWLEEGQYRLWVGGHNGDGLSARLAGYKALTTVFHLEDSLKLEDA